jgi:tetratricopeptide (TPR) repeat protein
MARSRKIAALLAVACAVGTLGGCARSRAQAEFRKGNRAYLADDFTKAIVHYEKAVALAPTMAEAHFYLANAHHELALEIDMPLDDAAPALPEAERAARVREHLLAAVKEYEASLAANRSTAPEFRRLKRDTLECLARMYTRDPLRDADKVVRYVGELEPLLEKRPSSVYLVVQVLGSVDRIADAESRLRQAREQYPDDPGVCRALADSVAAPAIETTERFDEAVALYESCAALEPGEAAGPRFLAMAYWSKGYRDFRLNDEQKMALADKGLAQAEKALALDAEDATALAFQGLLLRLKATCVSDPGYRRALIEQADAVREYAIAVRRAAAAAAAAGE